MRPSIIATLAAAVALLASPAALGQVAADGGGGAEVESLQVEIDRDWASLQTADCATACRALDSMRRAAERLCALEQGDRCANARQRVKDAAERVRATCPACAAANKEEEANVPPSPPPPAESAAGTEQAAPGRSGGCAACSLGPGSGDARDGAAAAALVALALALCARRQRRR